MTPYPVVQPISLNNCWQRLALAFLICVLCPLLLPANTSLAEFESFSCLRSILRLWIEGPCCKLCVNIGQVCGRCTASSQLWGQRELIGLLAVSQCPLKRLLQITLVEAPLKCIMGCCKKLFRALPSRGIRMPFDVKLLIAEQTLSPSSPSRLTTQFFLLMERAGSVFPFYVSTAPATAIPPPPPQQYAPKWNAEELSQYVCETAFR